MSYVYFAQCGDYVKIGFSYRPEHRIKGLFKNAKLITPPDLDRSAKVRLIHTEPDCVCKDERRMHEMIFSQWRVAGEWFSATPEFMRALADLNYITLRDERIAASRARRLAKQDAAA